MRKVRSLLAFLLIFGAGWFLWFIQFSPNHPQFSFAQFSPNVPENWRGPLAAADRTVAQGIRTVSHSGINIGEILPIDEFRQLGQATVSAEVSLTPEEMWRTFREKGSQAVLTSVGSSVEYHVNDVSLTTVNEARYQYCKGVVDAYESRP